MLPTVLKLQRRRGAKGASGQLIPAVRFGLNQAAASQRSHIICAGICTLEIVEGQALRVPAEHVVLFRERAALHLLAQLLPLGILYGLLYLIQRHVTEVQSMCNLLSKFVVLEEHPTDEPYDDPD